MSNFKLYELDGNEYCVLQIERDEETNEALLYRTLEERICRIKQNLEKAGSLEALEKVGGAPTKKFLANTRNLLKEFLLTYQVELLLTTAEDIQEAAQNVNSCDIALLVKNASWDDILHTADDMRNSLIDHLFARRQATVFSCAVA